MIKTLWRIELLGGLRAIRGDQVIRRFRTRTAGAMLAYLAYHPQPQSRELMTELFWPEAEPDAGRLNLRVALASLRRQLEPPGVPAGSVINASRDSIQLAPTACTTDVAEFEAALQAAEASRSDVERTQHLIEAVRRYGGELFPDCFQDWVLAERQRLAERFHRALAHLTRHRERAGDLEGAIQWARRAVSADPLREDAHHELIRLLATAGQHQAALRQYLELERLFEQELGAPPSPETQALARDLERGQRQGDGGTWRAGKGRVGVGVGVGVGDGPPTRGPSEPPLLAPAVDAAPAPTAPTALPTGTVTVLLIEMTRSSPEGALECLSVMRSLLRGHGAMEVEVQGELFAALFGRASEALAAAAAIQRALAAPVPPDLQSEPEAAGNGEVRVRVAVHTGEVAPGEEVEQSAAFQHAVRLLIAAHPGQILVSQESAALLGAPKPGLRLVELGRYHLGDALPPETLFQVQDTEGEARAFPPPTALPVHAGNLPPPLTRFFDRESEIPALIATILEEETRLVTLTGPAGCGKTRLAMEAALRLAGPFASAVYFVPLADLADAGQIPVALRDALRLSASPHREPLEQVIEALSRQPVLLVLDNFEHLAKEGAATVLALLERLPRVTAVVTSRRRLGLPGERQFPVRPLPVPRSEAPLEVLIQSDSIRLFVDRAQMVRPDFQVTPRSAPAVARLCQRLDGIPLALELAAARVRMLTLPQMLDQIDHCLEFLVSQKPGLPARHRTLRGALDWSYQLLSPEQRRFFARLSVFRGGWTLPAAESVCLPGLELPSTASSGAASAFLEELEEGSFILVEEGGEEMRFRQLETLREYGEEQLTPEEREQTARRHAEYYLELAERAEPELRGPDQSSWMDRLKAEEENLRAALRWTVKSGNTPEGEGARGRSVPGVEIGLRLGAALVWFWSVRAHHREVRQILTELLRSAPGIARSSDARAQAALARGAYAAGVLSLRLQDHAAATQRLEESLELYRGLDDRKGVALSLLSLADAKVQLGRQEEARPLIDESLSLFRELGDQRGVADALGVRASVADHHCDYTAARALYTECLSLFRELRDRPGMGWALNSLGQVAQRAGDLEAARRLHEQSLAIWQAMDDRNGIGWSLMNLGHVARAQGDLGRASTLYEEWAAITQELAPGQTDYRIQFCQARLALDQQEAARGRELLVQCLTAFQELGHEASLAHCRLHLGRAAQMEAEYETAKAEYTSALSRFWPMNDRWAVALCLEALAKLAAAREKLLLAARLSGAADALREALGTPRLSLERAEYELTTADLRAALGERAFAGARAEGRALPLEQVVSELLQEGRLL
jgi:predicted ATPase/DNA-binding SARP family transcriptional activator